MSAASKIDWSPAEQLLLKRDRYTAELIRSEFEKNPHKGKIMIDASRQRYVTPVVEDRYVVVWDSVPGGNDVRRVCAVVPTQLTSKEPDQVRSQIEEVVAYESKGKMKLE